MKYYPVNLDIRGRNCLVVGGGAVGTRKVSTLLTCGARVTVISLEITSDLRKLAAAGQITVHQRKYQAPDLDQMFLVIGATSDPELNYRISADAEKRNMLCNIADVPKACNFILPAIVSRGDLILAVSTSGNSPAFAKKLKQDLEKRFGEEYAVLLKLMGAIRKKLLAQAHEPEAHKHLFEQLLDGGLLQLIQSHQTDAIDALLLKTLGVGYIFSELLAESRN